MIKGRLIIWFLYTICTPSAAPSLCAVRVCVYICERVCISCRSTHHLSLSRHLNMNYYFFFHLAFMVNTLMMKILYLNIQNLVFYQWLMSIDQILMVHNFLSPLLEQNISIMNMYSALIH